MVVPSGRLTKARVAELMAPGTPAGRYHDGRGLYLQVGKSDSARSWILFTRSPEGSRREVGLGSCWTVPIEKARRLADEKRPPSTSLSDNIAPSPQRNKLYDDLRGLTGKVVDDDSVDFRPVADSVFHIMLIVKHVSVHDTSPRCWARIRRLMNLRALLEADTLSHLDRKAIESEIWKTNFSVIDNSVPVSRIGKQQRTLRGRRSGKSWATRTGVRSKVMYEDELEGFARDAIARRTSAIIDLNTGLSTMFIIRAMIGMFCILGYFPRQRRDLASRALMIARQVRTRKSGVRQ